MIADSSAVLSIDTVSVVLGLIIGLVPFAATATRAALRRYEPFARLVLLLRGRTAKLPQKASRPRSVGSISTRDLTELPELARRKSHQPYLYVTDLALTDFRCFERASASFRFPGDGLQGSFPNVNLLIGDNGCGKSSVLRAVGLACLGQGVEGSGYVPYQLVRRGEEQAGIEVAFAYGTPGGPAGLTNRIEIRQRRDLEILQPMVADEYWDQVFDESSPAFFVVGYGTNRRAAADSRADPALERGRHRRRYQRISGLFDDTVSLTPLGSWLPQARPAVQEEVYALIADLLPEHFEFERQFLGEEPLFRRSTIEVPLRAMSDGFRSYISWLSDLLFQLASVSRPGQRLTDLGGIALVDEVDLLLHPAWQRYVVATISRALPNIQFLFTTHSPLVTGTLRANNVIIARGDEHGVATLDRIEAEVLGLSADQVLRSSYFELESTRSEDPAAENLERLKRAAIRGGAEDVRAYLQALEGVGPDQQ